MKFFLLCVVFWCSHTAFAQSIDTAHYTIIKFDTIYHTFPDTYKSASLSKNEIDTVELILQKCITAYNRKELVEYENWVKKDSNISKEQFIISQSVLKSLNRQYIAVINDDKEKEIWVNCFPPVLFDETHQDYEWKQKITSVEDGGHDYFSVKINLAKKTYYDLGVNGD